ncbi:19815_t:CDS:2, partial [Entrophospora sp. SA101]
MSGLLKSQERKNMNKDKDKPTVEERKQVNTLEQYFKIPARDILSPGSLDNLDRQIESSAIDYVEGTLVKSYNEGCPEAFAKIITLLKERPIPLTLNGVNLSEYLFKELEKELKEKYNQATPEKQKEFKQKPKYDYDLASYLKQNNITPEQYKNHTPQEQLAYFYADKNQVKTIDLDYLNLSQPSELIIDNYPNLKEMNGEDIPNLTQLTITNCPQLEEIEINHSKNLQQLTLNNLPNLKKLDCYHNNLTTLDLSDCASLERISCS